MKISEKDNQIKRDCLNDRFGKIDDFFRENTLNTRTCISYDKCCVVPNYVLTATMRNETYQLVVFIAFENDNMSEELGKIVGSHDNFVKRGISARCVSPKDYKLYINPQRDHIFNSDSELASDMVSYLNDNVKCLSGIQPDDALYGCSLKFTQILPINTFFQSWESYISTRSI